MGSLEETPLAVKILENRLYVIIAIGAVLFVGISIINVLEILVIGWPKPQQTWLEHSFMYCIPAKNLKKFTK